MQEPRVADDFRPQEGTAKAPTASDIANSGKTLIDRGTHVGLLRISAF